MAANEPALRRLLITIAGGDDGAALAALAADPALARASVIDGATRAVAKEHFLGEIGQYLYAGDTALHIAAAAYRLTIVQALIRSGADVRARNRRGAQPLHYATVGAPGSPSWNSDAQAATVACLIAAGADPNADDLGGATPLHRAVRNRCAGAVKALLDGGADVQGRNGSGSTPLRLATRQTGRSGSGSPEAKAQQALIVELLERHGATA